MTERRADPHSQAVTALINTLIEQVKELRTEVHDIKRNVTYTHAVSTEAIEKAVQKAMASGFPDGDAVGHRTAHEQWLQERDERREMWAKVRSGLLEKAIWAALFGIGVMAMYYFGVKVK